MRPTLTESQQDPSLQQIDKPYPDNPQEQLLMELMEICPIEQHQNLTLLIDSGMTIEDIRDIITGWCTTSVASSTKPNVRR